MSLQPKAKVQDPGLARARDRDGCTPLHCASRFGRTEAAKVLLNKGADANAKSRDNWAPLHAAACRGHLDMVRLLLAKGANRDARDAEGSTALWYAVKLGHKDVVKLLAKRGVYYRLVKMQKQISRLRAVGG